MKLPILTISLACFTAVSAALLTTEIRAFGASDAGLLTTSTTPFSNPAMSLPGIQTQLLFCDHTLSQPFSQFLTGADLQSAARHCGALAARVIRWMPTHGFAHFVAAQSEHHRGNSNLRDQFLSRSQALSPSEGWLAQRRYALWAYQDRPPEISANDAPVQDISLLLTTQSGAELLASYYLHQPSQRTTLANVTADASGANRTRFLNQITQQRAAK